MIAKLYIIMRDFGKQMSRKNISAFAASTAFFLFLSLVPMLIVICTVIPFTPLTESNLLQAITEITPDMLDPLMVEIVSDVYEKSAGVLSVAAVVTLWTAGKGMLALIRGLNAINEVEEERNYFVLRAVASVYTFVMLVILIMSLVINVFGKVLLDMLFHKVPGTEFLFDILVHFRFLVVWLIMTVLFAAVYAYIPNKRLKFKGQFLGAIFSAVVWNVFSWGFSVYVEVNGRYNTYGSLTMIILVMLWLYFGIYIFFIGAHINRYFGPAYRMVMQKRKEKSLSFRKL